MPSIHFNYGTWWQWDPNQYPGQKVAFDAYTKIIYVNEGVTDLDVKVDIYSAYKEWVQSSPEYPNPFWQKEVISAIGGEPLNDTLNVGSTFFLENGWRIQPAPSKNPYILTVNGNIYTREAGGNPFLFAEGVSVNLTRSNLVDQLVATSTLSPSQITELATAVWQYSKLADVGAQSYGQLVQNIDSDLSITKTEAEKSLKKGEFLALQE